MFPHVSLHKFKSVLRWTWWFFALLINYSSFSSTKMKNLIFSCFWPKLVSLKTDKIGDFVQVHKISVIYDTDKHEGTKEEPKFYCYWCYQLQIVRLFSGKSPKPVQTYCDRVRHFQTYKRMRSSAKFICHFSGNFLKTKLM